MQSLKHDFSTSIFIVEDEKIVALDIAASLKSLGYNVIGMASSGSEAINKVREKVPDIILMDIRLKGDMDGISAAATIRSEYDVPVIYLTAYADESTLDRAKHTEPYGYLLKPYEKRVLHSTIEMANYKRKMETRIKESEKWLNTILTSIGDAVIATDINGKIKFINSAAEHLIGLEEKSALGKELTNIFRLFDESSKTEFNINLDRVSRTITKNGILVNHGGVEKFISLSLSPITDSKSGILGIVLIFQDITRQKRMNKEREDLFREVSNARSRLKILSHRLIEVQESEKRKLARELHDEIGQILTAIKINLQTAKRVSEDNTVPHMNDSIELVDEVLNQVRNLSLDLRPSMLDDLGLVPALRWYVDKQSRRSGIEASINTDLAAKRFSPETEVTCYRVIQEALNNIIKHSGAKKLLIELWVEDKDLHLRIKDDGKGFNVYAALRRALSGESTGILGMQERVELMGGKLRIDSTEGKGTDLHAVFPVNYLNQETKG